MITKHFLPIIAIIMVCMFVLPGYVQAAEYVDRTVNLEIESKYQDEHDEVVNVASESSIKNPESWNPAPRGIWIGASTQESLFKFDVVATDWNIMKVASVVQFNSSQIMNGASEFIIRSPIHSGNLESLQLRILKFTDDPSFDINNPTFLPTYLTADAIEIAVIDVDLSDVSITTGSDGWTIDNRIYLLVRCPVYSGINYAFIWNAELIQDASFQVYMSGQDICNDNITETRVHYETRPTPDNTVVYSTTLAIDLGISFDLLTGLGNGVFASSFFMESGDRIEFFVDWTLHHLHGYQTLMVPFITSSGTLDAEVTVYKNTAIPYTDEVWSDNDTWTQYVLACSDTDLAGELLASARVVLTVWEDTRVNLMFTDSPNGTSNNIYNMAIMNIASVEHTVFSKPWFSYQESSAPVSPPELDPSATSELLTPKENQKATWYGTIIGACLVVAGGLMIATGFLAPVGAVIAGVGTAMIIVDVAKGGHLIEKGVLPGWMENALDKVRDALSGIGEFILSIGEGLWDALEWLVDAIVEYGSVLLGLLIIAVALMLFFYPIKWQLGFWGMVWAMAEGDWKGAAKAAQGLDKDISRAMRTAAKVDRRVARAGKVLGKKWNEFDESVAGPENIRKPKRW